MYGMSQFSEAELLYRDYVTFAGTFTKSCSKKITRTSLLPTGRFLPLRVCVCVCFRPLIRFVAVALHCDLTRISLMINYVARFFTCLSTIHISLLKRLFRPFARLLIGLLVFLLGLAVLHIYSTNKSLSYMFCKYCLPVCGWYFYSLNSVCCRAEKF